MGCFATVVRIVGVRTEFGKSSFDCFGLKVAVTLGDGEGRVPRDPRQRKSIAS